MLAFGLVGALLTVGNAWGRCQDPQEILEFEAAVRAALRCRVRAVLGGTSLSCPPPRPPVCAGDAPAGVVDLVLGAAPTTIVREVSPAARCQRAVGAAALAYVRRRVPARLQGERAAPLHVLQRRIARRCRGVAARAVADGRLPGVGEGCAQLVRAGEVIDPARLGRCLSARLEALVDDVMPVPLRPSIVVILTDDQRREAVADMPQVLETLADRGVSFTNGFVTTSVCGPSRASIFSGLYAHNHGILDNDGLAIGGHGFDHENTLAAWMKAAGYTTGLFGKYLNGAHVLGEYKPAAWDEWQIFVDGGGNYLDYTLNVDGRWVLQGSDESDYSTDRLAAETARFIRAHRDEPFFVMYAPLAPHEPLTPASRHLGAAAGLSPWRPPSFREPDVLLKPNWVRFMKANDLPTVGAVDRLRQGQVELLLAVDDAVAMLSATLDRLGLTDNTVVLYLSDNGLHWGEHWWASKFSSYEEAIRIPFIMRYPRRYPLPRTSDALVLNIDVAPTLTELAGATRPPVNGRSVLPVLDGLSPGRDDFLIENFTNFVIEPNEGVRARDAKCIVTHARGGVREELYDLGLDPYELVNVAFEAQQAAVMADCLSRLSVLREE